MRVEFWYGFKNWIVKTNTCTATSTWMTAQGYFEDQLGQFDTCTTRSDPANLGGNAGYLQRKMCFAKLTKTEDEIKRKSPFEISDNNVPPKKCKVFEDDMSSRKRKNVDHNEEDTDSKKAKTDPELANTFVWTWTDEAIYFAAPIQPPLKFTPLLPEATIKIGKSNFHFKIFNTKY